MAHLQAAVYRDIRLDLTTIELRRVDEGDAGSLRRLIDDCIDECPSAVLLDLSTVDYPTVATTAITQAASSVHPGRPAVDVMAWGLPASVDASSPFRLYATRADAVTAVREGRERRPTAQLAFDRSADAPATVRRLVQDACSRWALDHVAADAALIISELVTNAIRHTDGPGIAKVSLREPYLHLAVEDQDGRPPRRSAAALTTVETDHGRGIGLVELLGSSWGHRLDHGGTAKVVWAAVPTLPPHRVP